MKLSERIKTYNFWVSLSSAIFLIIKVLGTQIGFNVDESLFSDLITSICSILVLLGIIVPPKYHETKSNSKIETSINNELLTDTSSNSEEASLDSTTFEQNLVNKEIVKQPEIITETCVAEHIQIEDVSIESANINIENIDNSYPNNEFDLLKLNFENELESQEKLFENNLDDYIKLLENKLNKIKSK